MEAKNILKQIAEIVGVQLSQEKAEVEKTEVVELAEQAVEQPTEQTKPAEDAKPEMDVQAVVTELQTKVTALETALAQIISEMQMSKEANVKLSKIVETIANTPISESIQRTETLELSSVNPDSVFKMFVNKK